MADTEKIEELVYKKLCENDLVAIQSLLLDELSHETTEKLQITRTPVLNSIGQKLGKLLLHKEWKFDGLKRLWDFSLTQKKNLAQKLVSGREIRLITIGALGVISKTEYFETEKFLQEIAETIPDWETCDQLALRVVVNLATKNREKTFSLLKKWLKSENKWTRRLSVATIPPYIRARNKDAKICLDLLNHVMRESDEDVRKAVGWALREVTKKDEDAVFNFLQSWSEVKDKNTMQIIKKGMKKLPEDKQFKLVS